MGRRKRDLAWFPELRDECAAQRELCKHQTFAWRLPKDRLRGPRFTHPPSPMFSAPRCWVKASLNPEQ